MSVVGIDFGNATMVVGAARHRGIDIIANEASRRETPALVGFKDNRRYLGESAATQRIGNIQNTISNIKRLIGKKWNQEDVQNEIKNLPYKVVQVGDNNIGIQVLYKGEVQIFSPEQLAAIIFTNMKTIVENDNPTAVKDVVISIPLYFNDAQRRAVQTAAKIAGLNCLRLLTEPLAIATTWGIYKKDLPEAGAKVVFVDFGESAITASVCLFTGNSQKGEVKIIGAAFDSNLGGRDFDNCLVKHFVEAIKEKYKMDVSANSKALFRLATSCEKTKNILTSNPVAPMNVESIMNDVDVGFILSRQEFEDINKELVDRAVNVVLSAIATAGIPNNEIHAVELVGGATRIPIFQQRLKDALGIEVSHTMNKAEAVAKGCALVCAILSPQFNVKRDFKLKGYNPYTMEVTWEITSTNGATTTESFTVKRGVGTPALISKVFSNASSVNTTVRYSDESEHPIGTPCEIGKFTIPSIPTDASGEPQKVKLSLKIDDSGLIVLDLAQASEIYYEDEPVPPAPVPEQKPESKADQEAGDKMETEPEQGAPQEPAKKKKVRKTSVPVNVTIFGTLPDAQIRSLNSSEFAMRASDQLVIQTEEKRNSLEAYIYDTRNKVQFEGTELYEFATETERNDLLAKLDDIESWLYGEGSDSTKEVYEAKLSELRVIGDPIEVRKVESEARPTATASLQSLLAHFEEKATTSDEKYSHIDQADKNKILDKIKEIREWLARVMEKQEAVPVNANPVVLSHEITNKGAEVDRLATPILNRPKPKPKPAEQPKPAESQPQPQPQPQAQQPSPDQQSQQPSQDQTGPNEIPKAGGPESMEVD